MFGLGFWEIVAIVVVILVFFKAEDLPKLARTAGKMLYQVRKAGKDLRDAVDLDLVPEERPIPGHVERLHPDEPPDDYPPPPSEEDSLPVEAAYAESSAAPLAEPDDLFEEQGGLSPSPPPVSVAPQSEPPASGVQDEGLADAELPGLGSRPSLAELRRRVETQTDDEAQGQG